MRALAVVTPNIFENSEEKHRYMLTLDDKKIPLALIEGNVEDYDFEEDKFQDFVQVKKTSFSLNYRDLGIIEQAWAKLEALDQDTYYPIGSDFSGIVIKKGKNVSNLNLGDLVIADCYYADSKGKGVPGIPSNHASKEIETYHKTKLIKVPDFISKEDAGTLSIGLQTSFSMVRKASINPGDKVLVTSVTSNTAYFLLNALRDKDYEVYGLSYSGKNIEKVRGHFPFIKEVFNLNESKLEPTMLFDVVLDPFSDEYLPKLKNNLNLNARYVTCGIFNQSSKKITNVENVNLTFLIANLMMRNVSFIGNCLGTTNDLHDGLQSLKNHKVLIDSYYDVDSNLSDFIEQSFNIKKNKMGKVSFVYQDN
jgi:NADPH:quinone reductase-like Zn-dependent oxidoreductase